MCVNGRDLGGSSSLTPAAGSGQGIGVVWTKPGSSGGDGDRLTVLWYSKVSLDMARPLLKGTDLEQFACLHACLDEEEIMCRRDEGSESPDKP